MGVPVVCTSGVGWKWIFLCLADVSIDLSIVEHRQPTIYPSPFIELDALIPNVI